MNSTKMNQISLILSLLAILLMISSVVFAAGQSSTNYTIESDVISGGGGDAISDNYAVEHTTGQPIIGKSESTNYKNDAGFWPTVAGSCDAPTIDSLIAGTCYSEYGTNNLNTTASDSCGGNLAYTWTPLNGGAIIGSGASVEFDPPDSGPHPCPYQIELQVTSDVSSLDTTQVIDVYIKNAGDANGDGVVNVVDKFLVRSKNGLSEGNPGWVYAADVTCDGTVNVIDKFVVRQHNGETGGCVSP